MSEDPVTYHYDRKGKLPVTNEMAEFEASIQRAARAHDELLRKLFGFVPEKPGDFVVNAGGLFQSNEKCATRLWLRGRYGA